MQSYAIPKKKNIPEVEKPLRKFAICTIENATKKIVFGYDNEKKKNLQRVGRWGVCCCVISTVIKRSVLRFLVERSLV